MINTEITTYEEAINDFLKFIKAIRADNRDVVLENVVSELGKSNLVVAEKILEYFQGNTLNNQVTNNDDSMYLTSLLAKIETMDITDYASLTLESQKLRTDEHESVVAYVHQIDYDNFCILEKRALETGNSFELQKLDEELQSKANDGNSLFQERIDIKQWLKYLEQHDILTQYKNNKRIAG